MQTVPLGELLRGGDPRGYLCVGTEEGVRKSSRRKRKVTVILGLNGVQIFFLVIKLLIAFYVIRSALRRNDRKMALGLGVAWLGIVMMSFYTLTIPGVLVAIVGMVYTYKCMESRVDQPFHGLRDRLRELREAPDSNTFAASTQVKKRKEGSPQKEIDEKYKKEKWK